MFNENDYPPTNYLGFLKANDSIDIPFNFNLNDSLMIIRIQEKIFTCQFQIQTIQ